MEWKRYFILYKKLFSMSLLIPPNLPPKGTIGIIAPSGLPQDSVNFYQSVTLLREKGYRVKFPRNLWPGYGYLADTDKARVDELHKMVADTEVDAIICLRGGYGTLRLLPLLDFEEIRKYPKYISGFSDISLLQNVLLDKIGLPAIHGPVMTSLSKGSQECFTSMEALFHGYTELMFRQKGLELLHGESEVRGQLIGGNLASLVSLLGTPYDFSWKNKVIFLEDIGEPLYKIDRMLTQLRLAGKFEEAAALLIGDFTIDTNHPAAQKRTYTENVWGHIVHIVRHRNIPVIAGVASGHCDENHALLLGAELHIAKRETRITTLPLGKKGSLQRFK